MRISDWSSDVCSSDLASFDAAIGSLIHDLRHHPAYQARVNALRDRLLEAPQVNDYVAALWQGLRGSLEAELAEPGSRLRGGLAGLMRSLGTAVAEADAAVGRASCRERVGKYG